MGHWNRGVVLTNVTCQQAGCRRAARVHRGQIVADGLCYYHHDWQERYGRLAPRELKRLQIRAQAASRMHKGR
jgi:hypothetical protein